MTDGRWSIADLDGDLTLDYAANQQSTFSLIRIDLRSEIDMLPAAYQLPPPSSPCRRILACFFGYRLFKVVLGVFGFIIGALAASSVSARATPRRW